jgi:hypothetical protein
MASTKKPAEIQIRPFLRVLVLLPDAFGLDLELKKEAVMVCPRIMDHGSWIMDHGQAGGMPTVLIQVQVLYLEQCITTTSELVSLLGFVFLAHFPKNSKWESVGAPIILALYQSRN